MACLASVRCMSERVTREKKKKVKKRPFFVEIVALWASKRGIVVCEIRCRCARVWAVVGTVPGGVNQKSNAVFAGDDKKIITRHRRRC